MIFYPDERAITVFAPVKEAFEALPQNIKTKIKNNQTYATGQSLLLNLLYIFEYNLLREGLLDATEIFQKLGNFWK